MNQARSEPLVGTEPQIGIELPVDTVLLVGTALLLDNGPLVGNEVSESAKSMSACELLLADYTPST